MGDYVYNTINNDVIDNKTLILGNESTLRINGNGDIQFKLAEVNAWITFSGSYPTD